MTVTGKPLKGPQEKDAVLKIEPDARERFERAVDAAAKSKLRSKSTSGEEPIGNPGGKPREQARKRQNERKACDAVTRVLEARTNLSRQNTRCPETDGKGPPVDYWFDLGSQSYALEHTRVEAFEHQIQMGIEFSKLVEPIVLTLSERMPTPGVYYLSFPLDPCSEMRPNQLRSVRDRIIEWVQTAGQELHAESPIKRDRDYMPFGHTGVRSERFDGLPFELTLTRKVHWALSDNRDGKLFVQRFAPEDLVSLRQMRIRTALNKKLPKLSDCRDFGAYTILVLEDNDQALTNHIAISDAIEIILPDYSSEMQPDEIFLVDTTIESTWTVYSLVRAGEFLLDDYRESNPAELDEV